MTHLADLFSPADLARGVDQGHVVRNRHPRLPLVMLSYTRACQYAGAWTAVTTRCRGLVVDERTGTVVAWPFEKFFSVPEHTLGRPYAPPLPDEPFQIYDKIDGTLGILFHFGGRWYTVSRGSFASPQGQWAQRWLDSRDTSRLRPGTTYLVEIVYPGSRMVVDYGDRQDLVLLAAYNTDGQELDLVDAADHWRDVGSVVRSWPSMRLADLLALTKDNRGVDGTAVSGLGAEGYVLRFASGIRAKAKLAQYAHLHKTATGVTETNIWRYLGMTRLTGHPVKKVAVAVDCSVTEVAELTNSTAGPMEALLRTVPDELDGWVRSVIASLEKQTEQLRRDIKNAFAARAHLTADRRTFARAVLPLDKVVRDGVFVLLRHGDPALHIWHAIRPVPVSGTVDGTTA
ncbi:RNA ligase [Streptomyces scopuliridis]|uniref:RNA ligase n=1 Tax=Streptomyces scopuliridis TaxID=452529 RepID=UPI00369EB4C9